MGNTGSQPKNKTGRNVVRQKLENAKKTGVLSLQEHKLEGIPAEVFQLTNLTTLDVSRNKLTSLGRNLTDLSKLKSLQCDDNKLPRGSLAPVAQLSKLQNLSAGGNRLGNPLVSDSSPRKQQPDALPTLPPSLKQLKLDRNCFSSVPMQVCSPTLVKLEKLDLSANNLATVPSEIGNLTALVELNLDSNSIVSLPDEVGQLHKLKGLSLKNNLITGGGVYSDQNPQPLPASLFTDTPVIDLNLHGNQLSFKEVSAFDGFAAFLERRKNVKSKDIYGGALTQLDVCGLE